MAHTPPHRPSLQLIASRKNNKTATTRSMCRYQHRLANAYSMDVMAVAAAIALSHRISGNLELMDTPKKWWQAKQRPNSGGKHRIHRVVEQLSGCIGALRLGEIMGRLVTHPCHASELRGPCSTKIARLRPGRASQCDPLFHFDTPWHKFDGFYHQT